MKKMLVVLMVAIFALVGCGTEESTNGEAKESAFKAKILEVNPTSANGIDTIMVSVIINNKVRVLDIDGAEVDKSVNLEEITTLKGLTLEGTYRGYRDYGDLVITK